MGVASPEGTMPAVSAMKKIGKTYKDSARMSQDAPEVTEHYEEGRSVPEVRKKTKKVPVFSFQIMDADIDTLVNYVGGTKVAKAQNTKTKWAFDGSEAVEPRSIFIRTEQGLCFEIPNADIEASINSDFTASGIFLVDFTITPLAVSAGKALRAYDPNEK